MKEMTLFLKDILEIMKGLLPPFLGLLGGVLGYLIITFCFRPILRYREIRDQVVSDLVFYADATNAEGLNENMQTKVWNRVESNKRHSADLLACHFNLPTMYKWYLRMRKEYPDVAGKEMMCLSNTFDHEAAAKRVDAIKKYLRIDSEQI